MFGAPLKLQQVKWRAAHVLEDQKDKIQTNNARQSFPLQMKPVDK